MMDEGASSTRRGTLRSLWLAVLLLLFLSVHTALEHGDRVSTMSQTLHSGFKTSWVDVPLSQMPRFRMPETSVLRVAIPADPATGKTGVNAEEDVKLSLTFADHKLILPWTVVFDARKRRSLKKLTVTFSHDQFDVQALDYTVEYGNKIARLDPNHPSITAFEISYRWRGVEGEDFALGVLLLFCLTLGCFVLLVLFVSCSYDVKSASRGGGSSSSSSRVGGLGMSSQRSSSPNSGEAGVGYSSSSSAGAATRRHHSGYRSQR